MQHMLVRRSLAATAVLMALVAVLVALVASAATAQYETEPIAEPVPFEARWTVSDIYSRTDDFEAWGIDGVDPLHEINGRWLVKVERTTDPRMEGAVTYEYNNDRYRSIDLQVHHSAFRIENDQGAWQEVPAVLLGYPDLRPSIRTGVFEGEGAYDGLVAVAELGWDSIAQAWQVSGYIIEGSIPALPGEGKRPD